MNVILWLEVVYRYFVVILDVKKQGEIIEFVFEECKKFVRYFEGDGGVMGGVVEGVVGVESDVQVRVDYNFIFCVILLWFLSMKFVIIDEFCIGLV